MRTRTIREGSVGLLLLLGVGVFIGVALWLRGFSVGKRSYTAVISFANVSGMQEGAIVRYRGVDVGKISAIRPQSNSVEVDMEISPPDLMIPRDALIEANQSGLISEVTIDITPQKPLPSGVVLANPLDKNCDRKLIICDGSRVQGQVGISVQELFRATSRFASVYSNPEIYTNVNAAAKNASDAAAGVAQLTRDLSSLTKATQQQLSNFSTATNSLQQTATQTATQLTATAEQIRLTTAQANRLIANLDSVVTTNRSSLTTALNNITQTSQQLRTTVNSLSPTLNRVSQGELIQNLETLSANAAQASANLRDVSNAFNKPTNLVVLQQTLDSARVTFQNTQKITSDLDELTGDPAFRENLRQLVNGLSGLVSSTQQLQQEAEVAQSLNYLTAVTTPQAGTLNLGLKTPAISNPLDRLQTPSPRLRQPSHKWGYTNEFDIIPVIPTLDAAFSATGDSKSISYTFRTNTSKIGGSVRF